jgi:DNA helicase II / ATP-dependent DNA helicase PcrA
LAIPYYIKITNKKPFRIDNEIYDEKVNNYELPDSAKSWLEKKERPYEFLRSIRFDANRRLIKKIDGIAERFSLKDPKSSTYRSLDSMKMSLLRDGYLHFDDAYFLANRFLQKTPRIRSIIQSRFQYVFVDEMQDMEKHQYDILENLFFENGKNKCVFQRIGDINQAIFNEKVELDQIWKNRMKVLSITGSQRLTVSNGELVNCFCLRRNANFEVKGLRIGNIKPCLIVYKNENIQNVLREFSKKIKENIDNGNIGIHDNCSYKAIGWTKKGEDGKIGIMDYCKSYRTENTRQKIDYPTLDCYLKLFNVEKRVLESTRKAILNGVIKILRIEEVIEINTGRPFTKRQFISYLDKANFEGVNDFKLRLYQWSINLIKGKFNDVYQQLKDYIPKLLKLWGKSINKSKYFILTQTNEISAYHLSEKNLNNNKVNFDGFDIEVATVHSVKGQTHTATLYMETFYEKGNNNYESGRLAEQIKFNLFDRNINRGKIAQQSVKMVYVGFSRPTHLLCFAVQKDRFNKNLANINRDKWDVIEI